MISAQDEAAAENKTDTPPSGELKHIIARFKPGWVIYNAFNIWAYIMVIGLAWGGIWLLSTFNFDAIDWVVSVFDWQSLGWFGIFVTALIIANILGAIGLSINYFIEYWKFELSLVDGQEGQQLRTTQGLFTTREVHRDLSRIRGIQLSEPIFWRWLRVTDTNVITTGLNLWSMRVPTAILPRTSLQTAREAAAGYGQYYTIDLDSESGLEFALDAAPGILDQFLTTDSSAGFKNT